VPVYDLCTALCNKDCQHSEQSVLKLCITITQFISKKFIKSHMTSAHAYKHSHIPGGPENTILDKMQFLDNREILTSKFHHLHGKHPATISKIIKYIKFSRKLWLFKYLMQNFKLCME